MIEILAVKDVKDATPTELAECFVGRDSFR